MTFGRAVLLTWCEYKDKNRDCLTRELGHILYCYTKEWGVADSKKKSVFKTAYMILSHDYL